MRLTGICSVRMADHHKPCKRFPFHHHSCSSSFVASFSLRALATITKMFLLSPFFRALLFLPLFLSDIFFTFSPHSSSSEMDLKDVIDTRGIRFCTIKEFLRKIAHARNILYLLTKKRIGLS